SAISAPISPTRTIRSITRDDSRWLPAASGGGTLMVPPTLPEGIAVALVNLLQTELGDPADQGGRKGPVVRHLERVLGRPVLRQLLPEPGQRRRRRREVEVGLERGEREKEAGLDEKRDAPLDRLLRLGGRSLQDLVELLKVRPARERCRVDVLGD